MDRLPNGNWCWSSSDSLYTLPTITCQIPFQNIFTNHRLYSEILNGETKKKKKKYMEQFKKCYKINCFSFPFSLKHPPPTIAGKTSNCVLICNVSVIWWPCGYTAWGSYDEPWWKTTGAKWEKFALNNPRFMKASGLPIIEEPWSAVAQNKEGSPPVLPEAIIKIKQNMLCNSKTWQVGEEKAFPAMATEVTFSKKSLGYYQVKYCGDHPAANQIKEKQNKQVVEQHLHFHRINNFKHSGKMKGWRTH